ncbi:helix-turn-helix domain-containing protein [Streptomyces sp. URMC 124]|uniref:helix-turn-helix domain-containing protein n=1 Tax=Streptomyces sp. URMC 124 TaxID=3423405 RepID=UPI003F1A24CE
MYRLRIDRLLAIAHAKGDNRQAAIAKRAQLSESSVSRFLKGTRQPDLNSTLSLAAAYGVPVESLMERVEADA